MNLTNEKYFKQLTSYINYLEEEEKSKNTILKYERDIKAFFLFLCDKELTKKTVLEYKEKLLENYATNSVNSMIAAINNFFIWLDLPELQVKSVKVQRELFINPEKELTQKEYERLIRTAEQEGKRRLSLLIQTMCTTGIRVSELKYITVQSVHSGRGIVTNKGKRRIIFLPKQLCRILKTYIREENIKKGVVFITKTGKPLDRSNIWKMMKSLCENAKVKHTKVFPHNLRHLFARTYYKIEKDIGRLADILGHSNINTTRVYMMETGCTHAKKIEKMNLVITTPINTT